jgi:hypothetical protein
MLAQQVLKITKWLWPVVLIPLAIALIPLFVQAKRR